MRVHACTIVARNYLAHARVLASSFRAQHPEGRFTVLVIDDRFGEIAGEGQPFDVIALGSLGVDPKTLNEMIVSYGVMELATAVKPWLLRALLEQGSPAVAYFDPDIVLYQPVADLFHLADQEAIVLTPHLLTPMPRDDRQPAENDILSAGVYNLGFIAVGTGSHVFLDWWSERLQRDCRVDPARQYFTDQRWIDFVPGFFNPHILQDPGCNVAYWNADQRRVELMNHQWRVGDVALRFFHFSGYDPRVPYLLSKHQGNRPRVLFSQQPDLRILCDAYGKALFEAGYEEMSSIQYGWGKLPNGMVIDHRMRKSYHEGLVNSVVYRHAMPPNPFDQGGLTPFIDWLREPYPHRPTVSRYASVVYDERKDVRRAFPDIAGSDQRAFLSWMHDAAPVEMQVSGRLLPQSPNLALLLEKDNPSDLLLPEGVNIAGYLKAELGVGEAARLVLAAVESVEIPHSTLTYTRTMSRQNALFEDESSNDYAFDINIVCVNADQFPTFYNEIGPSFFQDRYTIGLWFWEVEEFPEAMHEAFDYLNEVWVATEHIQRAISPHTQKPVVTMPLPFVPTLFDSGLTRSDLGLPEDRFIFLFSFDFLSIFERKNPLAIIEAFELEFEPNEGPLLVIKSINGEEALVDHERLYAAAAERPDILLMNQYMEVGKRTSLMALSDCYISLHRAEGLGLTMAEAMSLGKPVIATDYSGNLDFMNEKNSFLVPMTLIPVDPLTRTYPSTTCWADPDVKAAASLMRQVVEWPIEAARRAEQAQTDLATLWSPQQCGERMAKRLAAIRSERKA